MSKIKTADRSGEKTFHRCHNWDWQRDDGEAHRLAAIDRKVKGVTSRYVE